MPNAGPCSGQKRLTAVDADRTATGRKEARKAAPRAAVDALFEAGRARRARGEPSISSDGIVAGAGDRSNHR